MQAVRDELVPKVKALCGRAVGLVRPGRPHVSFAPTTAEQRSPLRPSAAAPRPSFSGLREPAAPVSFPPAGPGRSRGPGRHRILDRWVRTPSQPLWRRCCRSICRCRSSSCSTCRPCSPCCSPSACRRSGHVPVREAVTDGEPAVRGHAYIAPGDHHLTVHRTDRLGGPPPRHPGSTRQLVPTGGRSAVRQRRHGTSLGRARRDADRHGQRRPRRSSSHPSRAGRPDDRPGRGDLGRVGHARTRRRRRPRRRRPSSQPHRRQRSSPVSLSTVPSARPEP